MEHSFQDSLLLLEVTSFWEFNFEQPHVSHHWFFSRKAWAFPLVSASSLLWIWQSSLGSYQMFSLTLPESYHCALRASRTLEVLSYTHQAYWTHIPSLNEVWESLQMVELLLIPYLLIQDYQLPFDISPFCKFGCQLLLNLWNLLFLDFRGNLLQLLGYLLLNLALFLQLNRKWDFQDSQLTMSLSDSSRVFAFSRCFRMLPNRPPPLGGLLTSVLVGIWDFWIWSSDFWLCS